nr:hypothetical protein [Pseudonocardia sp. AL041005-10]
MLDEAAIAHPKRYDVKDLEHLYIRRTKTSPKVRDSLKGSWADRGPSLTVPARASPAERAVLQELATRWVLRQKSVTEPALFSWTLFSWTLFKSFLSSHAALLETITKRLITLEKVAPGLSTPRWWICRSWRNRSTARPSWTRSSRSCVSWGWARAPTRGSWCSPSASLR